MARSTRVETNRRTRLDRLGTDMARSTRLSDQKYIYFMGSFVQEYIYFMGSGFSFTALQTSDSILLPVTLRVTGNSACYILFDESRYPFTLRVTGISTCYILSDESSIKLYE